MVTPRMLTKRQAQVYDFIYERYANVKSRRVVEPKKSLTGPASLE